MRNLTLTSLFLLIYVFSNAQWTQLGLSINGDSQEDTFGDAVSINATGDIIAIGAPLNDQNGDDYGQIKVFQFLNNSWQQIGSTLLGQTFPTAGEKFGWDLDLNNSGTRLVVGSPFFINGTIIPGVTRVFEYNGTDWTQLGSNVEGKNDQDLSGWSVAINDDGSRIIIGSVANSDNGTGSGHARIFEYDGADWVQLGNVIEGEFAYHTAGASVDINGAGNLVAIGYANQGGPGSPEGIAEVRVFNLTNGNWEQQGNTLFEEMIVDDFGRVLSLNTLGNRIAVGARIHSGFEPFSGQVRVFEFQNNAWNQLGSDMGGYEREALGTSVDLNADGTVLVAGGRANNPVDLERGIARIFRFTNGDWEQLDEPVYGTDAGDRSGYAVGINGAGDTVVIGAYQNDSNGSNSGQVRTFFNDDILAIPNTDILVSTNLYPNPNNGNFNLDFSESLESMSVTIADITGKTLSSETFLNSDKISINHQLTTGVYFIKITSNLSEATLKMIVE